MSERSCGLLGPLELASRRTIWPIIAQDAERLSSQRLALVAEAAHVVPPIGAQGLNMSLKDLRHPARSRPGRRPDGAARQPDDAGSLIIEKRIADVRARVWPGSQRLNRTSRMLSARNRCATCAPWGAGRALHPQTRAHHPHAAGPWRTRLRAGKRPGTWCAGVSKRLTTPLGGLPLRANRKVRLTPLIQCRLPVGCGPSSKIWAQVATAATAMALGARDEQRSVRFGPDGICPAPARSWATPCRCHICAPTRKPADRSRGRHKSLGPPHRSAAR